jgi:hypothetical protein
MKAPMSNKSVKPLGIKAYGSIPHLPGSRLGKTDKYCHAGQAKICTKNLRDRNDTIYIQEKLDGSCVAVACLLGEIVPLTRAGYLAISSPYEQHHLFHNWAWKNRDRFLEVLKEGERLCGEWLCQAHSTKYHLRYEPFVVFDLMFGHQRVPQTELANRASIGCFTLPSLIETRPLDIEIVCQIIDSRLYRNRPSSHGAIDPIEGAVWRVERKGRVDFLAKWVRQDKEPGCYLPEISGKPAVWNWRP